MTNQHIQLQCIHWSISILKNIYLESVCQQIPIVAVHLTVIFQFAKSQALAKYRIISLLKQQKSQIFNMQGFISVPMFPALSQNAVEAGLTGCPS